MARSPVPQPMSATFAIAPALGEIAQDGKTQRRRLVMAGAERQPRLDAHRDHAMRHAALVVRAIDEETPRAHRRQTFLAQLDPVLIGQERHMHVAARKAAKADRRPACRCRALRSSPCSRTALRAKAPPAAVTPARTRPRYPRASSLVEDDRGFPEGRGNHAPLNAPRLRERDEVHHSETARPTAGSCPGSPAAR